MAFAAVVGPSERERIVAASSYYLSPATGLAEVAYMVDPEWQGAGLGGLLHARMLEYARERGVRGFRADVLMGNSRMMRVFERAGHRMSVRTSAGIEEVTMLFS
jgi:RimJ/RimL family protein N-acetyltransferase